MALSVYYFDEYPSRIHHLNNNKAGPPGSLKSVPPFFPLIDDKMNGNNMFSHDVSIQSFVLTFGGWLAIDY